jgi:hypothetical protein
MRYLGFRRRLQRLDLHLGEFHHALVVDDAIGVLEAVAVLPTNSSAIARSAAAQLFLRQRVALLDQPLQLLVLLREPAALRASSAAPEEAAACSVNCRILPRNMAMRSSSSARDSELLLLMM